MIELILFVFGITILIAIFVTDSNTRRYEQQLSILSEEIRQLNYFMKREYNKPKRSYENEHGKPV